MDALLTHLLPLTVQGSVPALAIALAAVAAGCFAVAAVLQHRAVDRTVNAAAYTGLKNRLHLGGLARLVTQRSWLIGLMMSGLGCLLHVVALVLAPVSLVQPIGVLAVPLAVLFAARHSRRRPGSGMVFGVVISVSGVGALVWFTAGKVVSGPTSDHGLLFASAVAGIVVAVLIGASLLRGGGTGARWLPSAPRWSHCVGRAMAGAICFGLGSALLRALAQRVENGSAPPSLGGLASPGSWMIIAGVVAALGVGGWLVQQAYASGPPEVVVACLTVVDPLVAVLFGLLVLSEGAELDAATAMAMIISALVAAAGVAVLVRHHPDAGARKRPDSGPSRQPAAVVAADHLV